MYRRQGVAEGERDEVKVASRTCARRLDRDSCHVFLGRRSTARTECSAGQVPHRRVQPVLLSFPRTSSHSRHRFAAYSLAFSPFFPNKIAVAGELHFIPFPRTRCS